MGTLEAIAAFMALLASLAAAFSPELSEDESEESNTEEDPIDRGETDLQASLAQGGLFFDPISL